MNTQPGKKLADEAVPAKAAAPDYPKFVSTTGEPVHLALLNGHTASVGTQPTPLHPRFHREAVIKGCLPEGFDRALAVGDENNFEATRDEVILKHIAAMVDEATADPTQQNTLFTGDGRPDATILSQRCGFQVRAQERDLAWEKYSGGDE